MPTGTAVTGTPCYVLMDGNCPIGPKVGPLNSGSECSAVYGFSDKSCYDKFSANSQLPLTPYPLVKGYLRNQLDGPGDGLKLVVIDAAGFREPCLQAATMQAVLDAAESHVTTAYRLNLDQDTNAYSVDRIDHSKACA
jgi:hypothetical protein